MSELRSGDQYPQIQQVLGPRVPLETVLYSYGPRGHELLLYYRGPTARESRAVRRAELDLALVEDQPLIVLLFRFVGHEWSAAPALAIARARPDDTDLSVVLVDAARNVVVAGRRLHISSEFAVVLSRSLSEQATYRPTAAELQERLQALRARAGHDRNLLPRSVTRCSTAEDQGDDQTPPARDDRERGAAPQAENPPAAPVQAGATGHQARQTPGSPALAGPDPGPATGRPLWAYGSRSTRDRPPPEQVTAPGTYGASADQAAGVSRTGLVVTPRPSGPRVPADRPMAPAAPSSMVGTGSPVPGSQRPAPFTPPASRPATLEGPDEYITLARAAALSGLAPDTLRSQATRRGQKLRVVRLGPRALVTTRRWLHDYLLTRDARGGHAASFPEGYQPPA